MKKTNESLLIYGVSSSFDFPTAVLDIGDNGLYELATHTGTGGAGGANMDINRRYVIATSRDGVRLIERAKARHSRIILTSRAHQKLMADGIDVEALGDKDIDDMNPDAQMAQHTSESVRVGSLDDGTHIRIGRVVFEKIAGEGSTCSIRVAGRSKGVVKIPSLTEVVVAEEGATRTYGAEMSRMMAQFISKGDRPAEASRKARQSLTTRRVQEKVRLPRDFWYIHSSIVEGNTVTIARDKRGRENSVAVFINEKLWRTGFGSQKKAARAANGHVRSLEEADSTDVYGRVNTQTGLVDVSPAKCYVYLPVPVLGSNVQDIVARIRLLGGRTSGSQASRTWKNPNDETIAQLIGAVFPSQDASRKFEKWYNKQGYTSNGETLWVISESKESGSESVAAAFFKKSKAKNGHDESDGKTYSYRGNAIARWNWSGLEITSAGFPTKTTADRLNKIIGATPAVGVRVFLKGGTLYLDDTKSKIPIKDDGWTRVYLYERGKAKKVGESAPQPAGSPQPYSYLKGKSRSEKRALLRDRIKRRLKFMDQNESVGSTAIGYAMHHTSDAHKIGTKVRRKAKKVGEPGALSLIREIEAALGLDPVNEAKLSDTVIASAWVEVSFIRDYEPTSQNDVRDDRILSDYVRDTGKLGDKTITALAKFAEDHFTKYPEMRSRRNRVRDMLKSGDKALWKKVRRVFPGMSRSVSEGIDEISHHNGTPRANGKKPKTIRLTVVRSPIAGEWMVAVYINGTYSEDLSYYTDDKADAEGTKRLMAGIFRQDGHIIDEV